MNLLVGLTNLVLGIAYCGYGVMTVIEMKRDWRRFGFSHFGLAWIFMAFTCGPHHLAHGAHVLFEGAPAGPLDLFAVAVGLPAGVIWLYLRVEAFLGGAGDRFIAATPLWLRAIPVVGVVYGLTVVAALGVVLANGLTPTGGSMANLALLGLYMAIGWFLLRTQWGNHKPMGGWSTSGVSLTVVFPTCALMHTVFAVYVMTGVYQHDVHTLVIDFLSIPASLYFLWVIRSLYRDSLRDWNAASDDEPAELEPALV